MSQKALFLDRDGVIIDVVFEGGWLMTCRSVEEVRVIIGVKEALDKLKAMGYLLIVVTNQPNVARGEMAIADVEAVHNRLRDEFKLPIDAYYYCPHDTSENCSCKKPKIGLIIDQAMRDFPIIDLKQSFVVGDREGDMELGRSLGCKTILIPSPATLWFTKVKPESDMRAKDLLQVCDIIMKS